MSTYKKLLSSDITITPFEVNKKFYYEGTAEITGSDGGVDIFLSRNTGEINFNPNSWATTGEISTEYQYLIYNSIKELYYSNFILTSGSNGTSTTESGSFLNEPQSDLYFEKYFPTSSNDYVGVFSIPTKLYGNRIQPKSFLLESSSGGSPIKITDDGEGNLRYNNNICGNIIYNQGLAIITSNGSPGDDGGATYGGAVFGSDVYGPALDINFVSNFATDNNITCSFSSSFNIYETQYKCTLKTNEFNYSLNPTLRNNSYDSRSEEYKSFVTTDSFSPFVTTVGLYNEDQELIAVGKLSQPLPTSQTTDTTIFINIDR
tara:strand:- start:278 stop:1231 length:954 start_codon:yes stop_codon:yes gene_type:complete